MTDALTVAKFYDHEVQPEMFMEGKKKRWKNTRANKDVRYEHFRDKDADIYEKERWAIELIKMTLNRTENPVVSCSFGIDSIVTLHLTRKAMIELGRNPDGLNVVYNNTLNEFKEVRDYAKEMTELWNLNVTETKPKKVLKQIIEDNGGITSDYFTARKGSREYGQPLSEKCCGTLKHEPMNRALKLNSWDLIINGLRADESNQRKLAGLRDGEFFYSSGTWKSYVARPILWWDEKDIWNYVEIENIPYNNLYKKNLIQKYVPLTNKHELLLKLIGLTPEQLNRQEIQTVTRKQAITLEELGFKIFTPRTGCQMCPIPVKYGYLQWMRHYYPKVYDAMVYKLGYGKALLTMVGDDTIKEIKALTGIDITADNAHEHLEEIISGKPCIFDEFS